MKIDWAIEQLQKLKVEGTTHVILGWWEEDMFEGLIEEGEWESVAEHVSFETDWSSTHDGLCAEIEYWKSLF
jgi:hypothetical protein